MLRHLVALCLVLPLVGDEKQDSELARRGYVRSSDQPLTRAARNEFMLLAKPTPAFDTIANFQGFAAHHDEPAWSLDRLNADRRAVALTPYTGVRVVEVNVPSDGRREPGRVYPVLVEIVNGPYLGHYRIVGDDQLIAVKRVN